MIIVWRVLTRCNLSCPFCAYDKRLDIERATADPERITAFIAVLEAWQRRHGRPVLLSWLGGEPFLWPALTALTETARAAGLKVSTTTNGTALDSARVRRHIVDHYAELTVSIDGFADFHDAMRDGPGTYDRLKRGVVALNAERRAAGSALVLRANVVLMRDNVGDFGDLCLELAGWGIDEICFNQLGGRDRPEFHPAHSLRADDIARLERDLPAVRQKLAAHGTRLIGGQDYLRRIRGASEGDVFPVSACRVAETFLFVDEQGAIAPCSFAPDHFARNVAELRTAEDLDALIDDLMATQRRRPAADCANCPSTQQFQKWA